MNIWVGGRQLVIREGKITRGGEQKRPSMLAYLSILCMDENGVRGDVHFKGDSEELGRQDVDREILFGRAAEEIMTETEERAFVNIFPAIWSLYTVSAKDRYVPAGNMSRDYKKRFYKELDSLVTFPAFRDMFVDCQGDMRRAVSELVGECRALVEYAKILDGNGERLYKMYVGRHLEKFRAAERRAIHNINYDVTRPRAGPCWTKVMS